MATTDEGVFKSEDEMYGGTTYYWRGAVENNYVKFANFCWRIVRINGDGSIRLIYDGITCYANGTKTSDNMVTKQAYNLSYDRSEYGGWTYTTEMQRGTSTVSNIKKQTENWYNNNIGNNSIYESKIEEGKFCNDRNTSSGSTWTSQSQFYYAGYNRSGAKSSLNASPTLNCTSEDVYTLKIGAITMDEIIMAGGKYDTPNSNYYLYNGNEFWTMTPALWNSSYKRVYVFLVWNSGAISGTAKGLNDGNVASSYGVRPIINLKSDVAFSSGNGTQSNPYVVE